MRQRSLASLAASHSLPALRQPRKDRPPRTATSRGDHEPSAGSGGSWKSQLLAAGVPLLFRKSRVIDAPGEPLVVDAADEFGGERAGDFQGCGPYRPDARVKTQYEIMKPRPPRRLRGATGRELQEKLCGKASRASGM